MSIEEKLLGMRNGIPRTFKQERWVTEQEGLLIRDLIQIHGANAYIESGTANGFSAMWAASGLPEGGMVYTFDPCDRPKLWTTEFGCGELASKIKYIQDGFETLHGYVEDLKPPVVVFIDGDHGKRSVLRDWAVVKPLIRTGDLVLFHDHNERPVQRAWHEIVSTLEGSQTFSFQTKRWVTAFVYQSSSDLIKEHETNFEVDSFWTGKKGVAL